MVVCKCRKATKLYCFVHKVPVCGECICFPEHQICVIRTYSEWVIDGEYNWPPKCCKCQAVLEEGAGSETTRLGCLDVLHTNCLISHIKSFPLHTAPAGYTCPSCSTSIWPPKSVKDSASRLHSLLKEAIMQTGMEKNLFGNHPPPAFASDPLININSTGGRGHGGNSSPAVSKDEGYSAVRAPSKLTVTEITEIDGPSSAENYLKTSSPVAPVATTRKSTVHVDKQNAESSYYADDEDGNCKKYYRRGPLRHKFLRALIPFWSSALPTLPVTAPPRKDADDGSEGRAKRQRATRMDPRKILLVMAIMACMATMGILYYRIAQRSLDEGLVDEEPVVTN
ncbi:ATP-dependent Clp protease proteolytic subunit-related protein 1 [Hibiscus syriacus]|uniref:ATP-dependent Clp protease proteolytic subunit-related protein 1 n=1 Tax=Hibiscus syriacus TaxID=106335 RepID=A0A6A2XIM8_HIBSY|nr:zinc finger protein-like 1 homolog [Hibiscus syriacus]KAE8669690.1 ATP-dependent Clp protease proteolytic subunit-related protein 1 [Hibiscus syriacus]